MSAKWRLMSTATAAARDDARLSPCCRCHDRPSLRLVSEQPHSARTELVDGAGPRQSEPSLRHMCMPLLRTCVVVGSRTSLRCSVRFWLQKLRAYGWGSRVVAVSPTTGGEERPRVAEAGEAIRGRGCAPQRRSVAPESGSIMRQGFGCQGCWWGPGRGYHSSCSIVPLGEGSQVVNGGSLLMHPAPTSTLR